VVKVGITTAEFLVLGDTGRERFKSRQSMTPALLITRDCPAQATVRQLSAEDAASSKVPDLQVPVSVDRVGGAREPPARARRRTRSSCSPRTSPHPAHSSESLSDPRPSRGPWHVDSVTYRSSRRGHTWRSVASEATIRCSQGTRRIHHRSAARWGLCGHPPSAPGYPDYVRDLPRMARPLRKLRWPCWAVAPYWESNRNQ